MIVELNISNYNPDVQIDLSRWYLRMISDFLSDYFSDLDTKEWVISVEICGAKTTNDLVYDSKTNKYKTYYFYLFITNHVNELEQKEKEEYVIDLLFNKLTNIEDKIKLQREIDGEKLETIKNKILSLGRNDFFRLEFDSKNDEKEYLDLTK